MFDIIIIGSGPAGMTSAIYGARMNLKVLVIEKGAPGGAMVNTYKIENYPGFASIDGATLSMNMFEQMTSLGVEFLGDEVEKITKNGDTFTVKTTYSLYQGKTVILATGTKNREIGAINEEKFLGRGISFCAICDGSLYKDKDVMVVGGGNSAIEEALYLANIAKKVYLVHRRDSFRAALKSVDELKKKENVEFILNSVLEEFQGDKKLEQVLIKNLKTEKEEWIKVDGVFEYVGQIPNNEAFIDLGITNDNGYVLVDGNFETKIEGLFACGDIIEKGVRQIATAVNDGAISALSASRYIK